MSTITVQLVLKADLFPDQEMRIRQLLMQAYRQFEEFWSTVFSWGSEPEYRLWLEDERGELIAHLGFGRRHIEVNGQEILIAGIGAVATQPSHQGQGFGRMLFAQLQPLLKADLAVDYGFLECCEAVVGFYQRSGLTHFEQMTRCFDPDEQQCIERRGAVMILPAQRGVSEWQGEGVIELRGMPW